MNRVRHWWQSTESWRTRGGVRLELEGLTVAHRENIIRYVTDRALHKVRRDMLFDLVTSGDSHDDVLADETQTIDVILDGADEEILARMPLVVRLRELNEQARTDQAQQAAAQERDRVRRERDERTACRIAERERLASEIRTLTLIAQENTSRHALRRIRDHLAATLTSGDLGISQLGHDRAVDLARKDFTR